MPHHLLVRKLASNFNICGSLWSWIKIILVDRQQTVTFVGMNSSWSVVSSGIPQGSVLGPLLFNLLINNISYKLSCNCGFFRWWCINLSSNPFFFRHELPPAWPWWAEHLECLQWYDFQPYQVQNHAHFPYTLSQTPVCQNWCITFVHASSILAYRCLRECVREMCMILDLVGLTVTFVGMNSSWSVVSSGIPQGSVLGPLLFNL